METFKRLPFQARQSVFQKLEQIVDIASLSKEERDLYDESIKVYRDNLAVRAYAVAEGRAEGRAMGLEEGRAEGRAVGLAEGRAEIVCSMSRRGLSIGQISDLTGLSTKEIESIIA